VVLTRLRVTGTPGWSSNKETFMSEFRPSSIDNNTVLRSAFGKAELEVAAMCVTNFLGASDANWDTERAWPSGRTTA